MIPPAPRESRGIQPVSELPGSQIRINVLTNVGEILCGFSPLNPLFGGAHL